MVKDGIGCAIPLLSEEQIEEFTQIKKPDFPNMANYEVRSAKTRFGYLYLYHHKCMLHSLQLKPAQSAFVGRQPKRKSYDTSFLSHHITAYNIGFVSFSSVVPYYGKY